MPAIFPDALAPIVRVAADGERQIETMRYNRFLWTVAYW
jgi:hypothetical protein